jgi:hypothetical protein
MKTKVGLELYCIVVMNINNYNMNEIRRLIYDATCYLLC